MKREEINIRDPYVLVAEDTYYLYGTRVGKPGDTRENGFDCYYSKDLEEWEGPVTVFSKPVDFWAGRDYWAPECHYYKESYYLFATFGEDNHLRGTQILKADHPLGPFHVHSPKPVTPEGWECLDGTLYIAPDETPYIVFSHEWTQVKDGQICAQRLADDLTHAVGDPFLMFRATDAEWVHSGKVPEQYVPILGEGEFYVTDGPFMYSCENGEILVLWSSFGDEGYAVAMAKSTTGDIRGPWVQEKEFLFGRNGGHGMIFTAFDGNKYLSLHSPNETFQEKPCFFKVVEKNGLLMTV